MRISSSRLLGNNVCFSFLMMSGFKFVNLEWVRSSCGELLSRKGDKIVPINHWEFLGHHFQKPGLILIMSHSLMNELDF